jgi:hypothetical protein
MLHFTDGSTMAIDTGSNAQNLQMDIEELNPPDFHVSLNLTWVPPLIKPNEEGEA